VASLTKLPVAAGILQLCEAGRLALDDAVATYLPEFANATVLVRYDVDSGQTVVRRAQRPITVRDLLTHTAGIHHGFVMDDGVMGTLYERAGVVHDGRQALEEKVARLGPLPLVHDPGAAWTYGLSSDVAGRVIEVIAGEPLDRYLARCVFEPLGMRRTSYGIEPESRAGMAARHVRANGRLELFSPDPHTLEIEHVGGGGGLYTTVGDYGRFVQALLDGGTPILCHESVHAMTTPQTPHITTLGLRYGLSVGVSTAEAAGTSPLPLGGFGWYGIFSTWFWAWGARRAVLLFSSVLDASMNLPLFSRVVGAVEGGSGEGRS
jgi:CubicO group peptidase (beta-lactamase class C family)